MNEERTCFQEKPEVDNPRALFEALLDNPVALEAAQIAVRLGYKVRGYKCDLLILEDVGDVM